MSLATNHLTIPTPSMQIHRRHQSQILQSSRRSFPQLPTRSRTRIRSSPKLPCYDWIFSSATNVHVAIDRCTFQTLVPLDSYILTLSGSQELLVKGIGSVDLKIRCKSSSSQTRVITLENVLYVPGWVCNIISDIYFSSVDASYEHKWTDLGLQFNKVVDGKVKPWGFTEPFCGLDRLVLSRRLPGRSPMQQDKEREVWSVNLKWPQSQRDKWEVIREQELQRVAKEHEKEVIAQQRSKQAFTESTELLLSKNQGISPNPKLKSGSPISPSKITIPSQTSGNMIHSIVRQLSAVKLEPSERQMTLSEVSSNILVKRDVRSKVGSLKATFNANRGLLRDFLVTGTKH